MTDFSSKKVLVAPLNWGLGHATRCIPIIDALLAQKAEVYLASDGVALDLLRAEYPELPVFELPAYDIRYFLPSFSLSIGLQLPKIIRACWLENRWLKQFVAANGIDIVISDNRFGCFSAATTNIFITHQVNIITPYAWMAPFVRWVNYFFIKKFDACWIPDFPHSPNLSGILGHGFLPKGIDIRYVGVLSRFEKRDCQQKYTAIAVLSGPEPQRTYFEQKVRAAFEADLASAEKQPPPQYLLVRGTRMPSTAAHDGYEVVDFLTREALNEKISESGFLICRSGYSTIMDLVALEKPALLVPTPGQTEQEYLAHQLAAQDLFETQTQAQFSLHNRSKTLKKGLKSEDFQSDIHSLAEIVSELLK